MLPVEQARRLGAQEVGFERRWLSAPNAGFGVRRFTGTPQPLVAGTRLFSFASYFASYEDLQRLDDR